MKNISHNSGFSLVLAIGIVLLLSLTGLYLIEYTIPFGRNIKGVENASQAFYESYAGVEDSLLEIYSGDIGDDHNNLLDSSIAQDYGYQVNSSGALIPLTGKGDSEYDPDWNQISQDQPISLFIGKNRLSGGGSNRIRLRLRIPNLDGAGGFDEGLDGINNDYIIWQLSSGNDSLTVASGSLISESDIDGTDFILWGQLGTLLSGSDENFSNFYNSDCDDIDEQCVLKISVINPLIEDSNDTVIPYLEYQLEVYGGNIIPLGDSYVSSQGKSFGFSKTLELQAPSQSTSSAFDFTVLQ